ncbi:hypothetical protein L21SP3_01599 [Sedimentisphaera cyanobacteriorum]|uniref:F5/8 type C domain protein n=1 Tax=Sedimentisphaera cyanobacteriorum TaxID=1940790 RepID=A0A1Q2HRC7_9BACT|nr:hypothetical protein [Sedimentisphaera cyanobacteriorum]AQQ09785.1 hypothetical protein L21SP3_01599 [Sedimentisphaera cyanobacteriorum]
MNSIANRAADLAETNILANGGAKQIDGEQITYQINTQQASALPENPSPESPRGLAGEALANGIDVTVNAAKKHTSTSNDRYNILSLIDGVYDNSHNGHRPYWSLGLSGEQDWYELEFGEPVLIDSVRFYEGDVVWNGVNTYVADNPLKGGFFEDIKIEVFKNGEYAEPSNITQSEPLEKLKMYQDIEFNFDPIVCTKARISGTAGGSYPFTTVLELEAYGSIQPFVYVEHCSLEDLTQNSRIDDISLQFSEPLASESSPEINIRNTSNSEIIPSSVLIEEDLEGLSITPDAPLPDGNFVLEISCDSVIDAEGGTLIDDDMHANDGYYRINFHSLFGDLNGDGKIDQSDYSAFSSVWKTDDPNADFNRDSITDELDLIEFADNWLKEL